MKELTLQIESFDSFVKSALDSGRRLDKGQRSAARGMLAFESLEGLLKLLTSNRWALLSALRKRGPSSIRALSKALARDYRGVHADVAALIGAGLIVRDEQARISVPWARITAQMDLDAAA